MQLVAKDNHGNEVWAHFDQTAQVWELFASKAGDDYLFCVDTIADAKAFARDRFAELKGNL